MKNNKMKNLKKQGKPPQIKLGVAAHPPPGLGVVREPPQMGPWVAHGHPYLPCFFSDFFFVHVF
jgi:hypothetical protein